MLIIKQLEDIFYLSLKKCLENGQLNNIALENVPDMAIERPNDENNGDFACTIALRLAKQAKMNPRIIASAIVDNIVQNDIIESVEIAGPGFINIKLKNAALCDVIKKVRASNDNYCKDILKEMNHPLSKKKINLEYVSANPTGPMHVGHGRWAALGDSIARILEHVGCDVYQEFYVNDHGVQMSLFANSINIRYLQALGQQVEMPDNSYGGQYVKDITQQIVECDGDKWIQEDKKSRLEFFKKAGLEAMMHDIKTTLSKFGNDFDMFFSESSMYEKDEDGQSAVDKTLAIFTQRRLTYSKDGALWFMSSIFGDDKDRVLVKENGDVTYFLSDCAYHFNKLERGFDYLIDIWGADHHGYIPRMKAMMQAREKSPDCLEVLLGQLVNLYRDGHILKMSKRSGEMITFDELINEVGVDATRYLMLARSYDQQIDFDIELAKQQNSNNPVYYVQYAHARICSILKKAYLALGAGGYSTCAFGAGGLSAQGADEAKVEAMPIEEVSRQLIRSKIDYSLLTHPNEKELCKLMDEFPEILISAAEYRAPHKLVRFSQDFAAAFHQFYTNCRVMDGKKKLRQARYALCDACRICLALSLNLLGVSAPVKM